jgi:sugar phosphate isomerase/epimerase
VDRPNLGVCLDNVNLIRVGDDMAEGTRALAPHTLLVQLKDHEDGDPTAWGGPVSTALGEGIADLDGLIAILAAAGYDGPVCVELASLGGSDVDELAMIERSVGWLRGHLPADNP